MMSGTTLSRRVRTLLSLASLVVGCSSNVGKDKPVKDCDVECQTRVMARGLRETLKLAYNLTLNGKPVGAQDASHACLGGSVRVTGEARSNAEQGSTEVDLRYDFSRCQYRQVDATEEQNYDLTFEGSITQSGVLTVQPTAPTALIITSDGVAIEGSVFDPPSEVHEASCEVRLQQSGNKLSGTLCGRPAGVSL